MFSTNDAPEMGGNKYITAGVNAIKIVGFSATDDERALVFKVHRLEATEQESKDFRFYITPKAIPYTMGKIKHLASAVGYEQAIDAPDVTTLVKALNVIFAGKELEYLFNGREYENANGELKVAADVSLFPPFASAVGAGILRYDETNSKHLVKLPVMDDDTDPLEAKFGPATGGKTDDGSPF